MRTKSIEWSFGHVKKSENHAGSGAIPHDFFLSSRLPVSRLALLSNAALWFPCREELRGTPGEWHAVF